MVAGTALLWCWGLVLMGVTLANPVPEADSQQLDTNQQFNPNNGQQQQHVLSHEQQRQQQQQFNLRQKMHDHLRQQQQKHRDEQRQQQQQQGNLFAAPQFLQAQQDYLQYVLQQQQQQQQQHQRHKELEEQEQSQHEGQLEKAILGEEEISIPSCEEQVIAEREQCAYDGQRCPIDGRQDGFVVCDKSVWLFMECAPGTSYGREAQVCVDPLMASYISGHSQITQENMDGSTAEVVEPKVYKAVEYSDAKEGRDAQDQAKEPTLQGSEDIQQTVWQPPTPPEEAQLPAEEQTETKGSQDDWQIADAGETTFPEGREINFADARELVYPPRNQVNRWESPAGLVIAGVCELGAIQELPGDPYSYKECIYNDLNSTDWIDRPCPDGAMFSKATLNCGNFTPDNKRELTNEINQGGYQQPIGNVNEIQNKQRIFTGPQDGPAKLWFGRAHANRPPPEVIDIEGRVDMKQSRENPWVNENNKGNGKTIQNQVRPDQHVEWVANADGQGPPIEWLQVTVNGESQPVRWIVNGPQHNKGQRPDNQEIQLQRYEPINTHQGPAQNLQGQRPVDYNPERDQPRPPTQFVPENNQQGYNNQQVRPEPRSGAPNPTQTQRPQGPNPHNRPPANNPQQRYFAPGPNEIQPGPGGNPGFQWVQGPQQQQQQQQQNGPLPEATFIDNRWVPNNNFNNQNGPQNPGPSDAQYRENGRQFGGNTNEHQVNGQAWPKDAVQVDVEDGDDINEDPEKKKSFTFIFNIKHPKHEQ